MLWVALHFPGLPNQALAPLAGWACQFTPRVAQAPPDALLAEAEASLRYFGGQDVFLRTLRAGLDALGVTASLAVAPTGLAALWLARGGGGSLETLPLAATGFDLDFFRSIGVATVGEALALPRDGLAQRCGSGIVDALDRACGRLPETYAFFAPPASFSARLKLPGQAAHAEALLFPSRPLLAQLEGRHAARSPGRACLAAGRARRMGSARVPAAGRPAAVAAGAAAPPDGVGIHAARRAGAHRMRLVGRRRSEARLLHRPAGERRRRLDLPRRRRVDPAWLVCLTTPICIAF